MQARVLIASALLCTVAQAEPVSSVFTADEATSSGATTLSLSGTVVADAGFATDSDTFAAMEIITAMPGGAIAAAIDPVAATIEILNLDTDALLVGALADTVTLFLIPVDVTITPGAVSLSLAMPSGTIPLIPTPAFDVYAWGPVSLTFDIAIDFSVDTSFGLGPSGTFEGQFTPMVSGTVNFASDTLPYAYTVEMPGPVSTPIDFMGQFTIGMLTADVSVDGLAEISDFEFALLGSSTVAVDTDSDGVFDAFDNCVLVANADQYDVNGDAIGNLCDPDITGAAGEDDCAVNFPDLAAFKLAFFSTPSSILWNAEADLTNNGIVNFEDLDILKQFFFGPPGPSASGCN